MGRSSTRAGKCCTIQSESKKFGRHQWQYLAITFMLSIIIDVPSPLTHSLIVQETKVHWTKNDTILSEQKAVHDAPRSQKYWDEHGIERPDYAKTDAVIAVKRQRQTGGINGQIWQSNRVIVIIAASIVNRRNSSKCSIQTYG